MITMSGTEPYHLHASLGYQLSLAARIQERRLEEHLKSLGLTRTTWCVLLAIGNEGLGQPSDIARFIGIDRTAASRALRQMQERGLIDRVAGKNDRRTRTVVLTELGAELLVKGTPMAEENNSVIEAHLGDDDREELVRLLKITHSRDNTSLSRI